MRQIVLALFLAPAVIVGKPAWRSDRPIDVKIRVETFGRLSSSSVARMRQEIEGIWRPASVRLAWRVNETAVRPTEEAADRNADITVLIENQAPWPNYAPSPETLAQSTIYHPPTATPTAVIVTSLARTRQVIEGMVHQTDQSPVLVERLIPIVLGRAIAHEIGHYLLGTSSHEKNGLMRARFGPDDARVIVSPASVALDSVQILSMRKRWNSRQPIAAAVAANTPK